MRSIIISSGSRVVVEKVSLYPVEIPEQKGVSSYYLAHYPAHYLGQDCGSSVVKPLKSFEKGDF
jgi:hypothetical protein